MKVYAYTDGASRGNPGKGASGYLLLDGSHRMLESRAFYNGICTNNVAEYEGVVAALKKALELFGKETDLVLVSDSKLVINQLSGAYKIKSPNLKALNREARGLLSRFKSHRLLNVGRENEYVSRVDRALNALLDGKKGGVATVFRQKNLKANE
jgi:ribonuclease HI